MADFGNTNVISPVDANNNHPTLLPSWRGDHPAVNIDELGRASQGAAARWWQFEHATLTTTGAANTYVVTYPQGPEAYFAGMIFNVILHQTNTGASTFQVAGLGVLAVKKFAGGALVDLAAGDLTVGGRVKFEYNGTLFIASNAEFDAGSSFTNSIAEIAALDTSATNITQLNAGGRSGIFVWTTGNLSARVTSDVGQGQYIAPISEPTGVLGAWVRRTDRPLNPFMFGVANAVTGTSQHVALQRFFDALSQEAHPWVDWSGDIYTDRGITFGSAGSPILTRNIEGTLRLSTIAGGAPEEALRLANPTMMTIIGTNSPDRLKLGELVLIGSGSTSWASRNGGFFSAAKVTGLTRVLAQRVRGQFFKGFLWDQSELGGVNNNLNQIAAMRALDCGSYGDIGSSSGLTANFSNRVDSGSASSSGQTTTVDVDVMPPLAFDAIVTPIAPIYVWFAGTMHLVTVVDRANSRLTLLGWPDLRVTSGPLVYCFGGGAIAQGGDSGLLKIGSLDAFRCGVGLSDGALYGAEVNQLQAQACGIGWVTGRAATAAKVGGRVGVYMELNQVDTMQNATGGNTNIHSEMGTQYAYSITKVKRAGNFRSATNVVSSSLGGIDAINLKYRSRELVAEGRPMNGSNTPSTYLLDMNLRRHTPVIRKTSPIVKIVAPDAGLNDTAGIDQMLFVAMGAAAGGGAPTSVTVKAPDLLTATFTANATTDELTLTQTFLKRGSPVRVSSTVTVPSPLVAGTIYYAVPSPDEKTIKLSSSLANANAGIGGTTIDLTDAGSGTMTLTQVVTVNGVEADAVFTSMSGPALFAVYWRVIESDYVVTLLGSFTTTAGTTAMTGTAQAGALAAHAKGTDVPSVGAAYSQAEVNAIVTRLNAVETALQSLAQRTRHIDAALFTAGVLRA